MAADYNSGIHAGGMGFAPHSRYYIGQVWSTADWIDIALRLINDAEGNGAVFLLEAPLGCYVSGLVGDAQGACPIEVWPEFHDFISTITANDIVAVNIPGNGISFQNIALFSAGVNMDDPQYVLPVDDDYELGEFDTDVSDSDFEFDYPDGDIDWGEGIQYPSPLKKLRRSSRSFSESGSIIVAAGISQDLQNYELYSGFAYDYLPRRSRKFWSSYGSRADVQGRAGINICLAPQKLDN